MGKHEIKEKFEEPKYYKRKDGGTHIFVCHGRDEHGDYIVSQPFNETMAFSRRDFEMKKEFVEVENFDIETLERQTCGRRGEIGQRTAETENPDYWVKGRHGELDGCSYCGSAKFETFLEIIAAINEDKEGYSIEKATGKGYKYYLSSPECSHIKFYTPHIPREIIEDEAKLKELNEKLSPACTKSHNAFVASMRKPVKTKE